VSWSPADIPDLSGRTALVTGVSVGGLGQFTALELARAGARVVLAGRNPDKLTETERTIREQLPDAPLERLVVDLADQSSVRSAGAEATEFGPFLLTGLLLPQLADGARVVTVSSQMHRVAHRPPLGDPRAKPRPYLRWVAYSRTKLANLLFTFELDRRLRAAGSTVKALAAHPGYAGTHLVANGRFGRSNSGLAAVVDRANRVIGQSPAVGAWPILMAATADLPGSTYCGPGGLGEAAGAPQLVGWSRQAGDRTAQRMLWELSEAATGIAYP
jgi:NAD(P)-dependent dehydrogenase (short-subunit alcohol dehydrogenase family)